MYTLFLRNLIASCQRDSIQPAIIRRRLNITVNGMSVDSIEMDFLIVVDPVKKHARSVALGKIRKGDLVVVGEQGVSVSYPERPRESSTFEFMHRNVSPERPSETLITQIAREILDIRRQGEK